MNILNGSTVNHMKRQREDFESSGQSGIARAGFGGAYHGLKHSRYGDDSRQITKMAAMPETRMAARIGRTGNFAGSKLSRFYE